jgi:peptide/nickel transport system substrate-binding protein
MVGSYWGNIEQSRLRRRRLMATGGAFALGSGLLAACGGDEPGNKSSSSKNEGKPVTDKLVLGVNYTGQETNDYRLHGGAESWLLRPHYESLITLDRETGAYAPQLAKEWKFSDDGLRVTFKLQEGVKFHDNWGEMTAEDIVWNYNMHKKASREGGTLIRQHIREAQATGPYEVTFHLLNPIRDERDFAFTDKYITAAIASKKHWEAAGDSNDLKGHILAGTGPWKLGERQAGSFLRFNAVENHWRKTPDFKQLEYRIINENSTRLSALLANEVHMVQLPPDLEQSAVGRGMTKITGNVAAFRVWMDFWGCCVINAQTNQYRHPNAPLLDLRVRKALNKAIDRNAINKAFLNNEGIIAYNAHIDENREGWNDSWKKRWNEEYGHDPKAARSLLEAAGYSARNPLRIVMLENYQVGFAVGADVQETIIAYWKAVGVETKFEKIDRATERPRAEAFEFDNHIFMYTSLSSAAGGLRVYNINPESALKSDPAYPGNFRGMNLKEINEIYAKIERGVSDEEYDKLMGDIGELAYKNHLNIPMFWLPATYIANPSYIHNWSVDGTKTGLWSDLEYVEAKRA